MSIHHPLSLGVYRRMGYEMVMLLQGLVINWIYLITWYRLFIIRRGEEVAGEMHGVLLLLN